MPGEVAGRLHPPSRVIRKKSPFFRPVVRPALTVGKALETFGGTALAPSGYGLDTDSSDLDILIGPTPETTLFDIGAIRHELGSTPRA